MLFYSDQFKGVTFEELKEGEKFQSGIINEMKSRGGKFIVGVLLIVILLLVGTIVFGYFNYYKKFQIKSVAKNGAESMIEDIGKLMILPNEETPMVATITDINKLIVDNKEFYGNAQNSDVVLFYSTKAIIYSPQKNIIVNVAPIVKSNSSLLNPDALQK